MTVAVGATGQTGGTTTGGTMTGGVTTGRAMTGRSMTGGTAAAGMSLNVDAAEAGAETAAHRAAELVAGMPAMSSRSGLVAQRPQLCVRGMGTPAGSWTWVPLAAANAAQMKYSGWVAAATADIVGVLLQQCEGFVRIPCAYVGLMLELPTCARTLSKHRHERSAMVHRVHVRMLLCCAWCNISA
jgi:hypothetical protein